MGNMTIREAFGLAAEAGIRSVAPVHRDMSAVNSANPEEIGAIYKANALPFKPIKAGDIKS